MKTKELIRHYISNKEVELKNNEVSPEYLRVIRNIINTHLRYLEEKEITEISFSDIEEIKNKENIKIKTKKNILILLHSIFVFAKQRGFIKEIPPFPKIKGNDSTQRRAVAYEKQKEILQRFPENIKDVFQFAMETGVRPGELISILCKSVNLRNREVWIERTKSGKEYRETTKEGTKIPIPLSDIAYAIVKRNIEGKSENDFLFVNPTTGRGYTYVFLNKTWRKYVNEYSIYEATRHSFCSHIVPLTDPLTAQRLMRHASIVSTNRYYHTDTSRLRDIVNNIGG